MSLGMLKTFTLALATECLADANRKMDKYADRVRELERENSDLKTKIAVLEAVAAIGSKA